MSQDALEIKPDVLQALVNNDITLEEVQKWGSTIYPQHAKNNNIIARLYLRSKGIFINVSSGAKINTLGKDWTTLDVLVASKLDPQKYTGCPKCNKSIKEAKVEEDAECPKCGLVEAATISWPRYIAGDDTGEIILKFGPTIADNDDYTGSFLKIRGKVNEYKGNITFDVNRIDGITTPKGTTVPATTPTLKKEKVIKPTDVQTPTEVNDDPIPVSKPTTQPTQETAPVTFTKEVEGVIGKFSSFIRLHEQTGNIDTPMLIGWFEKQKKALNITVTVDQALDKLGYQLSDGNIVKKA